MLPIPPFMGTKTTIDSRKGTATRHPKDEIEPRNEPISMRMGKVGFLRVLGSFLRVVIPLESVKT